MKMTMKTMLAAAALAMATAVGAHAQTTPTTPGTGAANPEMPSALECKQGYREDMRWTKDDFDAACTKVRSNAVPAGQRK